jgi:hypothetical protein
MCKDDNLGNIKEFVLIMLGVPVIHVELDERLFDLAVVKTLKKRGQDYETFKENVYRNYKKLLWKDKGG